MKNLACILLVCFFLDANAQKITALQRPKDLTTLKYSVEEAPEWTALLKRSSGWFGGDGIFTIPLNGREHMQASPTDKILFLFSDSMIGEIKGSTLKPGYIMTHNSVAILNGNVADKSKITFYW